DAGSGAISRGATRLADITSRASRASRDGQKRFWVATVMVSLLFRATRWARGCPSPLPGPATVGRQRGQKKKAPVPITSTGALARRCCPSRTRPDQEAAGAQATNGKGRRKARA